MDDVARVVLALEQHDVAEEVMHFLDRSGRARVVATAADDRQLVEAVRQLEPDAIVAQPSLVAGTDIDGCALLALETRETTASLRAAIAAGARGFYLWPTDRDALAGATAATIVRSEQPERRASVIGVHAARGGAGATFVATHLSRALARMGKSVILIDADTTFGDIGIALGAPVAGPGTDGSTEPDPELPQTLGDLLPLDGEIAPRHLDQVLWEHREGFRVLLAPAPEEAARIDARDVGAAVEAAAAMADVVVVHLPRSLDEPVRATVAGVDRLIEILSLDVLSFRAATRTIEALRSTGVAERMSFVVNRAARGEIVAADVERVFGRAPLAVLPHERAVARAQDNGRLLPARGKSIRSLDRLARRLLEAEA